MKSTLALIITLALLACLLAGCGLFINGRDIPLQGSNPADLNSDEIIRRIVEITGAADDDIFLYDTNIQFNVSGNFDWAIHNYIPVMLRKKRFGGVQYYGCQLQMPESGFFLTKTWKISDPQPQYKLYDLLDALKYLPQEQIRSRVSGQPNLYSIFITGENSLPDNTEPCIFYDRNGITERRDWRIRLVLLPMVQDEQDSSTHRGVVSERMHLFFAATP